MTPLEELPEEMPTEAPQTDCEAVKKEWETASKTGRVSAELMQKALQCKLVPENKVKAMPTGESALPTRTENPLAGEDKELGMAELIMSTAEEALEDLKLSYNEAKELLPELPEFIFEHKYDVASFLQLFSKKLSLTGLQTITGINRKQLNHYVTGHRRPSKATVKKISEGLKKFKEELNQVSFV